MGHWKKASVVFSNCQYIEHPYLHFLHSKVIVINARLALYFKQIIILALVT